MAELAAKFVVHAEANTKKSTANWYKNYLRRFVLQFGGRKFAVEESGFVRDDIPATLIGGERPPEARKLDLTHGNQYKKYLMEDCCLMASTINHNLTAAKVCLGWASKPSNRIIPFTPWEEVKPVPEEWRTRIVTDDEFALLIKHVTSGSWTGSDQDFRDMLYILRYTAMRPQELRVLTWDMIDYEKHLMVIPASLTKTFTTAKTPKPRYIPILDEAEEILRRRQAKRGSESLVFPDRGGQVWKSNAFSLRFRRLRVRAGLDAPNANGEKIVPYSLRHTRLTEAAVHDGLPFFQVKLMAGHQTNEMTKRYVTELPEHMVEAARAGRMRRLAEKERT